MSITIKGELEIDHVRGVVYFHDEKGKTVLRICQLGKMKKDVKYIDVTLAIGVHVE